MEKILWFLFSWYQTISKLILKSLPSISYSLCEKCPNTEFFLVCIKSEYRKIRTRKNSVFGHFSRTDYYTQNPYLKNLIPVIAWRLKYKKKYICNIKQIFFLQKLLLEVIICALIKFDSLNSSRSLEIGGMDML